MKKDNLLQKYIVESVKSLNPTMAPMQELISGPLNVFKLVFCVKGSKDYLSLELFFNDTDVYGVPNQEAFKTLTSFSGEDEVISDSPSRAYLESSLHKFIHSASSLSEALNSFITESDKYLPLFLEKVSSEIKDRIIGVCCPGITVISVDLMWKPTACVFIHYALDGVLQRPLKGVIGGSIVNACQSPSEAQEFIEMVNEILVASMPLSQL